MSVIVRLMNGASVTVPQADAWTEPPTVPAVGESLFVNVLKGDLKIASFNPTEVLALWFDGAADLED